MSIAVSVHVEATPNPRSLKFLTNVRFLESGGRDFPTRERAGESPLASKLHALAGIDGVYIGTHFVTVTKTDDAEWPALSQTIIPALLDHLGAGLPVFGGAPADSPHAAAGDDVERRIQAVLDEYVRPTVAQDGGDVLFHSFDDGVVRLHLQGACSGCPSATMTLRMGIQNMLCEQVPEVKEVVQV